MFQVKTQVINQRDEVIKQKPLQGVDQIYQNKEEFIDDEYLDTVNNIFISDSVVKQDAVGSLFETQTSYQEKEIVQPVTNLDYLILGVGLLIGFMIIFYLFKILRRKNATYN